MRTTLISIVLFSILGIHTFAQRYSNKEFALFEYNVMVTEEIKAKLEPVKEELDKRNFYKNNDQDKLVGRVKDMSYAYFTRNASKELNYYILPINSFTDKFNYDPYNYPEGNIKRAIKYGASDYYFKLDLMIDEAELEPGFRDSLKIEDDFIIPEVHFSFSIYNEDGHIPIRKLDAVACDTIPLIIQPEILNGLKMGTKSDPDTLNIMHLIEQAIAEVIEDLK